MTSITLFLMFIPILTIVLLGINLLFAPHAPYQEKNSVFECGYHSFLGQNRTQFSVSFFIFALLFLLFDLEILLIYPYVVSAYNNEVYGLINMLMFFLLLTLGFAFELGKNALKIDSKQISQIYNKSDTSDHVQANILVSYLLLIIYLISLISLIKFFFYKKWFKPFFVKLLIKVLTKQFLLPPIFIFTTVMSLKIIMLQYYDINLYVLNNVKHYIVFILFMVLWATLVREIVLWSLKSDTNIFLANHLKKKFFVKDFLYKIIAALIIGVLIKISILYFKDTNTDILHFYFYKAYNILIISVITIFYSIE